MDGIETERTFLRMFTMDDLDDLARILSNPQVMRYQGHDCQPISRDETEVILASLIKHWERKSFGRWAVISKEDNKLIGCAGLRSYQEIAELLYLLDEPYWGKGIATELGSAILEYGFEKLNFDRIIAVTRPENVVSRRVLEKLGMRFEKETIFFGIFVAQYTISRKEYQSINN